MTTYRELIYMCLDLLKSESDDFTYTEEHIAYLLDKYRALLLKQRYGNDPKKHVPYSNYQTISIELLPIDSRKINRILPGSYGSNSLYSTYPVKSIIPIRITYWDAITKKDITEIIEMTESSSAIIVPETLISYEVLKPEDDYYFYLDSNDYTDKKDTLSNNSKYYTSATFVPYTLQLGIPRIITDGYYDIKFEFVNRERLPFIGYNKYLKNIRYCGINENNLLCVVPKEGDDFFKFKNIKLTAIFESPRDVQNSSINHWMDNEFPLEESLVSTLIETVVNVLTSAIYKPDDNVNDNRDDLASLHTFLAKNLKSDLAKKLTE